jgi:hypothetical protein
LLIGKDIGYATILPSTPAILQAAKSHRRRRTAAAHANNHGIDRGVLCAFTLQESSRLPPPRRRPGLAFDELTA